MWFTCPKYVNLRAFNKSTMSFSINNSFNLSTFLLLSFLVISLIFLSTEISNTLNFLLWCFLGSMSQNYTEWLTEQFLSFCLSHDTSWVIFPPKYTNSWHCSSWQFPNIIFICCSSFPILWTTVLELLTVSPNLLLVVWTASTSCCR